MGTFLARLAVVIIVCASLAPSIAINVSHALQGDGSLAMVIVAVMSVVVAPACLTAMPALYRQKRPDLMAGSLLLFALSLGFNSSNAIGLVASDRDNLSEGRAARMAKITRAEERRSRLTSELANYRKIARDETVAMVDAELLRLKANPVYARSRECGDVTLDESRDHCSKIADAFKRQAAAVKVEALNAEIHDVTASLNSWGAAPLTADPKVDRVARVIGMVAPVSRDDTGFALDVFTALLIECLGALLPAIAIACFWPRGGVTQLAGKSTSLPERLPTKPSPNLGDTQNEGDPNMGYPQGPEPLPENPPFPEKPDVVKPVGNQATSGKAVSGKSQKTRTRSQRKGQHIPESVGIFARKCIVRRSGAEIQANPLYGAYADDCRAAGIEPVSQKAFGLAMAALGYRKRTGRLVVYEGIALLHIRPSLAVVNG